MRSNKKRYRQLMSDLLQRKVLIDSYITGAGCDKAESDETFQILLDLETYSFTEFEQELSERAIIYKTKEKGVYIIKDYYRTESIESKIAGALCQILDGTDFERESLDYILSLPDSILPAERKGNAVTFKSKDSSKTYEIIIKEVTR